MANPAVELVLTLPQLRETPLYLPNSRTTAGVLTQLVLEANIRLAVAAPFMQVRAGLSEGPVALAIAAALARGVSVDIVGTREGLGTLDVAQLTRSAAGTLRLWEPSEHVEHPERLGSHAKFCIADDAAAYVGSAHFTGPGLGSQLEMGVLVRGDVAAQISAFFELACRIRFFVQVAVHPPLKQAQHRVAATGPAIELVELPAAMQWKVDAVTRRASEEVGRKRAAAASAVEAEEVGERSDVEPTPDSGP
jgi:phosphatidylserine/phosphatidylglycerophosphate/cardiolipin synthase-like enzyme